MSAPMTRPRLLIFAPSAYLLGGLATWLDGLLPGLEDLGWDVELALPAGRTFDVGAYLRLHPWTKTSILRNPGGTAYGRRRAVRKLVLQRAPAVCLTVNFPEALAAATDLARSGDEPPRMVGTVHGLVGHILQDFRERGSSLTAAVGTSKLVCEALRDLSGVEPRRIFHAPYGTRIDALEAPEHARSDIAGLVFAGRIEQDQKRVLDLIPLARALDQMDARWTLRIVGTGPEEECLRTHFASDRRVSFLGHALPELLRSEFSRPGSILVLTSAWETGPLVAWEAMERGAVLVSSRYLGSAAEGLLVDGANCKLFAVGDTNSAAQAIADVTRNPEEMKRLASGGRRLVEKSCQLEGSVARWSQVLEEAIQLPHPDYSEQIPLQVGGGRLSRWLGPRLEDALRRVLRSPGLADSPGDEWPHTASPQRSGDDLIQQLAALEARSELQRRKVRSGEFVTGIAVAFRGLGSSGSVPSVARLQATLLTKNFSVLAIADGDPVEVAGCAVRAVPTPGLRQHASIRARPSGMAGDAANPRDSRWTWAGERSCRPLFCTRTHWQPWVGRGCARWACGPCLSRTETSGSGRSAPMIRFSRSSIDGRIRVGTAASTASSR